MKKLKLLLIDSSALIYRAFYALPPLTDKKGRVVNAVYGFMAAFLNILKQTEPTHVIFAFDSPKPTKRAEKYGEYKAHREKAPDELYAQIPISKDLVKNLAFVQLEKPGYEADDIIATCAKSFTQKHANREVVIATGDLDTLQLIDSQTKVFALSRGITEAKLYDKKAVLERFGLEPEQMNDFKAMFGDPSDNIKGIKGVGQKTAAELLQKYHTLKGVYENLEKLKPRLRDLLTQEKEQAFLSRELVTLDKHVPVNIDLDKAKFTPEDLATKKECFEELSFNSLGKRVESLSNKTTPPETSPQLRGEKSQTFSTINKGEIKKRVKETIIQLISSQSDLEKQVISALNKYSRFVLWSGESIKGNGLAVGILENNQLVTIYFIDEKFVNEIDKSLPKDSIGFGFDLKKISKDLFPSVRIVKKSDDLKLKAYLIQPPLMRKFGFKEVLWHFLKEKWEEPKKQLALLTDAGNNNYDLEKVSHYLANLARLVPEVETAFAEQVKFQGESKFIEKIFPAEKNKIKERSIDHVYKNIERPLANVLARMEDTGVKIDRELTEKLRCQNAQKIEKLKEKIYHLAHREFNLDSPSQLADILFEKLKISTEETKKGKAGHFSTAAGVLEKLEGKHPVISLLLNYREQRKFQTTYLDVIPGLIDPETKRLRTSFDQTGTATGRLSSNNPNLQNVPLQPIEGDIGIRHAFVAEEGFKLISLDYSQIEIRLAAYLSGEEKLVRAFERGKDVHRETAAFVNNVNPERVDENMRNAAKALNFGIIYGMSPFGFAAASKLSEREAKVFIDNYFHQFPNIASYINSIKEFAREHGFVETVFGRRRYVPEIASPNRMLRQAGERMAINMPLQGTAADIMKLALVAVNKFLEEKYVDSKKHPLERGVRILLSIHDEIILEARNDVVEKIAGEVKEIMENVARDIIPLKVEVEIGKNWGEI